MRDFECEIIRERATAGLNAARGRGRKGQWPCLKLPFDGPAGGTALVAGLVAQPVSRTVCGMLTGAGLARVWHHCRAHRFFSAARWCPRQVGLVLAGLRPPELG